MSEARLRGAALKSLLGLLVVCLAVGLAATRTQAAPKVLGTYETRLGPVQILTGEPQHRLIVFKGHVVHTGTDFMKVDQVYRLKNYDAILVRDYTGPLACPVQYFFLTLQDGTTELSETFGHCSDQPKIKVEGQKIHIQFAAFGSEPAAGWHFDGARLAPEPPPDTADQAAPKKE